MQKHGVILNMSCDRLTFWPGYCQHSGMRSSKELAPISILNSKPKAKPEAEPHAEHTIDAIPKYIVPAKRANTKQTLTAMPTAMPMLSAQPQATKPTKPLELAMIGAAPFHRLARKKNVEIFAISMQNIEYQLNKAKKPATDLATVVLECYHDFLNVFSKEDSDKILLHSKYDHNIKLLQNGKDHGQATLCNMLKPQLQLVKKFLEEHLKQSFIEASRTPCLSLILLAKKPGGGVRFCVDCRKLNALTKKDAYPIPLIVETLAQLKKARIFTKIDICQAFHKLRIVASSENLTTMATQFGAYKWKVMSFGLIWARPRGNVSLITYCGSI